MNSIRSTGLRAAAAKNFALAVLAFAAFGAFSASESKANARGEQLYRNCVICHGANGEGNPQQLAPALHSLSEKYIVNQLKKYKNSIRGAHPDDVAGLRMLPMAQTMATEDDMKEVAAYIASMDSSPKEPELEGGDAAKGATLYATCVACHGPEGKGNDVLNSPSLLDQYDWYLATQLAHFKAGVRGANPQDITGAQMRPMSMTLTDEQAIKDVVAYIQSLSEKQ